MGRGVENRRIFVGETHPISERAPIAEARPCRMCVERENRRKFRAGEKKIRKRIPQTNLHSKGHFCVFCSAIGCKFVRLSIHRKHFATVVMLIFVSYIFLCNAGARIGLTRKILLKLECFRF